MLALSGPVPREQGDERTANRVGTGVEPALRGGDAQRDIICVPIAEQRAARRPQDQVALGIVRLGTGQAEAAHRDLDRAGVDGAEPGPAKAMAR